MFGRLFAALICAMSLSAIGQAPQPDYQRGTITAVTAHQNTPGESSRDVVRYDVSVKVGNTNYVVLFTPPNGSNTVEYSAGTDMLFLVGDNTLTFNSTISGKTEMPILRREALPPRGSLDLSRASGQYFSLKLENLSAATSRPKSGRSWSRNPGNCLPFGAILSSHARKNSRPSERWFVPLTRR